MRLILRSTLFVANAIIAISFASSATAGSPVTFTSNSANSISSDVQDFGSQDNYMPNMVSRKEFGIKKMDACSNTPNSYGCHFYSYNEPIVRSHRNRYHIKAMRMKLEKLSQLKSQFDSCVSMKEIELDVSKNNCYVSLTMFENDIRDHNVIASLNAYQDKNIPSLDGFRQETMTVWFRHYRYGRILAH